jgi:6-phosphogluconolactonase (cycloisomerase 2 family)
MSGPRRLAAVVIAALAAAVPVLGTGASASADEGSHRSGFAPSAFIQTNAASGNTVLAYHRSANGSLTPAGVYPTGGLGASTAGAPSDPLASQGSLVADRRRGLLLGVNAGSDTVSVFRVRGTALRLTQVLSSGGDFPVSLAVSANRAYVVNAGGSGSVSTYRIDGGHLDAIRGSTRSLGLPEAASPPFFLSSPAQIGVSPDGRALVVTTKINGFTEVFPLDRRGVPADQPVRTATGPVPFPFLFDRSGRLVLADASGQAGTWRIDPDGGLTLLSAAAANQQAATCWLTAAGGYFYATNTGSDSITGYRAGVDGSLSLLDASGVTATTDAGPIDIAASVDGSFVYELNGNAGTAGIYAVAADGSLTRVGRLTGLPVQTPTSPGMEGLVVT